jgi:hypothetical protein
MSKQHPVSWTGSLLSTGTNNGFQLRGEDLKIRHGLGKIDRETYDVTIKHINEQVQETSKEMGHQVGTLSNLDKLLNKALEKLAKLSRVWDSSDLENKRRIQKTLFPDGIYYDVKNHGYLTTQTNCFISLTKCISDRCEGKENGNLQDLLENSRSVARTGQLSNQMLIDLLSFSDLPE